MKTTMITVAAVVGLMCVGTMSLAGEMGSMANEMKGEMKHDMDSMKGDMKANMDAMKGKPGDKSKPISVSSGIWCSTQSSTSSRDQTWPGRTSTGAAFPGEQMANAMPFCLGPAAPDQSTTAKCPNDVMA